MAHLRGNAVKKEGPLVTESFYWDGAPTDEFLAFVNKHKRDTFSGATAISKNPTDDNGVPQAFVDHCIDIFNRLDYPVQEWRYWFGVTLPGMTNQNDEKFARGFPHAHSWEALTLIHYVQTADEGGELVIVDDEHNVIHTFVPRVGASFVVDGWSLHGVLKVTGTLPRYTLIATGFRRVH